MTQLWNVVENLRFDGGDFIDMQFAKIITNPLLKYANPEHKITYRKTNC